MGHWLVGVTRELCFLPHQANNLSLANKSTPEIQFCYILFSNHSLLCKYKISKAESGQTFKRFKSLESFPINIYSKGVKSIQPAKQILAVHLTGLIWYIYRSPQAKSRRCTFLTTHCIFYQYQFSWEKVKSM